MINITSLSHKLGKTEVLKGVNLTVPDSTILGLAGVNGAGKSTLLRLLAGVYLPDEGGSSSTADLPPTPQREPIYFSSRTTPIIPTTIPSEASPRSIRSCIPALTVNTSKK